MATENAGFGNHSVSVLLGNGDGTFQTGKPFAVGGNSSWVDIDANPNSVAIGDLNKDGKPDLAVVIRTG